MIASPHLNPNRARITLVGAGPGDPELITLKGLRAIQSAAVILYDSLVNPLLLDEAHPDAELVYVGKRAGSHKFPQEEINEMLVRYALKKGHVVRLKGGDPFVFGRGFEEMDYAMAHGVPVQVVPGISSCTSVAGLQQVPLTCRGVNESFWVVTGTTRSGALSKDLPLAAQSSASIVILMGIRKLPQIAQLFAEAGKADLPCMVVQSGSCKEEQYVLGTVSTIAERAATRGIGSPGIIYIGEVVRLHAAWTDYQTLSSPSTSSDEHTSLKKSLIPHFSKTA